MARSTTWPESPTGEGPVPLGRTEPADGPGVLTGGAPAHRTPGSAAAFTEAAMLRPVRPRPEHGWRRGLYELTGGHVNLGPSRREQRDHATLSRVTASTGGCQRVAVLSRKGGVGKTTTTLMLGHTFASLRGDRVVAVDGNPDAGSLAYRVPRDCDATIGDLLDDRARIKGYPDVRRYTSQASSRLEVVASDDNPRITDGLGRDDHEEALQLLAVHYNLVLVDTGTGILHSATRGILDAADQLVVVVAPSLDGARAAAQTLDWLDQHGYAFLTRQAVAAVNRVGPTRRVQLDRIQGHFAERCRAVVRIPEDHHLHDGAQVSLDDLRPRTRTAYVELAAAVADGFSPAS